MKTQVIICPAYKTLSTENWYKWLEGILNSCGYDAKVIEFPNPQSPSEKEWVEIIKDTHFRNPIIFVGHSLGCRAILAYLNQYNISAQWVMLIACPMFVGHFDIFHDTTDHLLPVENAEYLKDKFGEKAFLHISDSYDHFDIPELPEVAALF